MIYRYTELAQYPQLAQRALSVGKLDGSHEFIELPNGFDFQGIELKPVIRGAGDVVAMGAKPIAMTLDKILGTDIQNCGGCAQRQDWLNKHLPL